MTNIQQLATIILMIALSGCARDLSSSTYTADSTLSLTLQGEVLSVREIKIKNSDKLENNMLGGVAGGAMGAALGSGVGKGSGNTVAMVGGAILGGVVGAGAQQAFGTSKGYEYMIKVDTSGLNSDYYEGSPAMRAAISSATTSGLITVIQGKDVYIPAGKKVFIVFSDNRTRVIPAGN
jgi:outer membrane lipoprotein SlyB